MKQRLRNIFLKFKGTTFHSFLVVALFGALSLFSGAVINTVSSNTANAAACTTSELSKNSSAFLLDLDSQNIRETKTGKFTQPGSGRTEASCEDYSADDKNNVFTYKKDSGNLYIVAGTCGDRITLSKTATSSDKTVVGAQQDRAGSGGTGEGCYNVGSPQRIDVSVVGGGGSGTGTCTESFTLFAVTNEIRGTTCSNGTQSSRVYVQSGNNKLQYLYRQNNVTGTRVSCGAYGQIASLTLKTAPPAGGGTVNATLQPQKASGQTCVNDGASSDKKVTVLGTDCSSLGEYSEVGCTYALETCKAAGADKLSTALYVDCVNNSVNDFKQMLATCSAGDADQETIINCLIEKAPIVTAQLNALLDEAVNGTTCAIEGVGWIVCPGISFMATIADSAFSFLSDNFLSIDVNTISTGSEVHQVWSIMRNIANLAFVVAFLFIIFSQMTGQGIANYGIKKMLPRLVIAAILVNVSFFICQVAIDLSNILGYSLHQLFQSVGGGVTLPNGTVPADESGNWAGIALTVLAGGVIAWSLGVTVLLPFLLGAVVALIMVFLILVVRQMLIILLVVVAPIAFVAFLLPNTEQWFTKWRKMFVALLLVFPLIGLLFGAAGLASTILRSVTYSTGDETGLIGQIVAAGIIALPLFLLPSLLKTSINSVGNIGSKLNGLSDKFSKGTRSKTANTGLMKNYAARKAEKRNAISTGTYKGISPIGKLRSRVNSSLNNNSAFNMITRGYGADRTLAGQSQQRKDAQEAMSMFAGNDSLVEAWALSGGDFSSVPAAVTADMTADQKTQLKTQFTLMRNAGLHKKPTSYLAAAQYLSENGKGSASAVQRALSNASASGASSVEVGSAGAAAVAAYRKSGRGDAWSQLSNLTNPDAESTFSLAQGWAQVAASAVHRDALGYEKDEVTGKTLEDADGNKIKNESFKAYEAHLQAKSENTRQALAGYDSMEQRAKEKAQASIIDAAKKHELGAIEKLKAAGIKDDDLPVATITDIQSAKDYFKIK